MSVEFSFLAPGELLNANHRLHWSARSTWTKAWRNAACSYARNAMNGARWGYPRAHIVITISWPDGRRRDVNNYQPTAKAIVDGIVDAGILPDDNDHHLVGPDLRRGERCHWPVPYVTVRVEEVSS